MKEETIKVWITKYALTQGIFEKTGVVDEDTPSMFCVRGVQYPEYYHGEGRDWHRTRESALKKANSMRKAKIASLKKQIEALEKKRFT